MLSNLSGKTFGFEAWYSLEDCVSRLERKSERKTGIFASRNTLLIKVSQVDRDNYTFIVDRDAGRGLVVKAAGRLRRRDASSTLVSGQVNVGNQTMGFLVIWSALFIGLMALVHLYVFSLFGILIATVIWSAAIHARNQSQTTIEDILSN